MEVADPVKLMQLMWPKEYYYQQQREIAYSIWNNDETVVVAGNMLGKDFIAARIILAFFLSRHPCRIVTTSAKDDHLRVLWGEIGNAIQTCSYPLDTRSGGPLIINHQNLRKIYEGEECKLSYVTGMVASPDSMAAMQGHHIAKVGDGVPRTMFVSDESSSVPNDYFTMADTWANRMFLFGNAWECNNRFKWAVEGKPGTEDTGGDIRRPNGNNYYRKVFRIKASDSPNVRYALAEKAAGLEPSGKMLVPGVKDWYEYSKNLVMWDDYEKCVKLDAEFYKGSEIRMFPTVWLEASHRKANEINITNRTKGKSMGVDPGEGGANTCWSIVDDDGLINLISLKTPDTSYIPIKTVELMKEYSIPAHMVFFDRGGGGKQHADYMRKMGINVKTVAFGEPVTPDKRRGLEQLEKRKLQDEERYTYLNRRAEMYMMIRLLIDPYTGRYFAIPSKFKELIRQLVPIPLLYDGEGRVYLPPKNKKDPNSKIVTLVELLGCSPDEADSLALAVYGICHKSTKSVAGAIK